MTNNGYIQLYWKTTEWIYWEYDVGLKLFIYLLLTANWKESVFRGKRIPRGSLAISMRRMVNDCGHSEKTVRKWLERFALEGQVEVEPTNQYTVIKIVNYERYQDPSSGIGRYIKLSRSLLEWKYWHSDKAVKCWIYLLLSAGREGNECDVVCEKACEIARKCFLDEEEVHKWFEQFAADGQIELNDINGIAHIKILNFFGYQGLQTRTEQCNEQGTERCTERGTERGTERCTERGTERGTDIIRLLKSEKNKKTNKNYRENEEDDDSLCMQALLRFRDLLISANERMAELMGDEEATIASNEMENVATNALRLIDRSTVIDLIRAPEKDIDEIFSVISWLVTPGGSKKNVENKPMYLATAIQNHFRCKKVNEINRQLTMMA